MQPLSPQRQSSESPQTSSTNSTPFNASGTSIPDTNATPLSSSTSSASFSIIFDHPLTPSSPSSSRTSSTSSSPNCPLLSPLTQNTTMPPQVPAAEAATATLEKLGRYLHKLPLLTRVCGLAVVATWALSAMGAPLGEKMRLDPAAMDLTQSISLLYLKTHTQSCYR